jgi:hypothetical protein
MPEPTTWTVDLKLPPIYDPQEVSARLREIADQVDDNEDVVLGEMWGRDGRLLGAADLKLEDDG